MENTFQQDTELYFQKKLKTVGSYKGYENFLKKIALQMQAPKKEFYGLAMVKASTIRESNFKVVYTPIHNINPFHSDVKIGYTVEKDIYLHTIIRT